MGKDNHKKCSAQGDASHKKNYKEYTATVDDIERVVLGRAFVEQGFPKVVQRHARGYLVVRRSAEEMMAMRRMTARESREEQVTDVTDIF